MVMVRDSWSRSIDKTAAGSNKAATATEDAVAGCSICGSGDVHFKQSKISRQGMGTKHRQKCCSGTSSSTATS